ncbi:hypothetical protein DUNSADRAFT_6695 [Dunaliella salina]|uniref:Uncharacterized protein n=1 Tax=Dunaliella salina TaxID=3046 RepID=A0ABQ7GMT8_DUNSA|nr:hypothetical protein DUNSADRAFT_6695 [Dunaliella salina]|eukprot:KAF5835882.1 hypothetical protein DUNSADRAFT_6695 [Dunaliella salina]
MKTTIYPSASSCVRGCSTAPATLVKPAATRSSPQSALEHVALPHNKQHPLRTPKPSLLAPCAAGQGWEQPGSEPEDAAYNELLAHRREERMRAIREASRRARFNPLNRKAADAPEKQQDRQEQPAKPLPQSPPASPPGPITFKSGSSKAKSAMPSQPKHRPAGAPMRPALSARRTRRKGGGLGNMPRRSMPSSMQQRRQQWGLAGDNATNDVFDGSEDDDDDDDDDDIDPQTMAGLEALAAQLMQEGGLEELDVTVDGEPVRQRGSPAIGQGSVGKSAGKEGGGSAAASAAGPQGRAGDGEGSALNDSSSSSSMRARGRPQTRDPFQDPAFIQRLEALMADDSDDDDALDVDAKGVQGQGQGLLSQLPGGERINHKEMEDMEDIDWCGLGGKSCRTHGVGWFVSNKHRE